MVPKYLSLSYWTSFFNSASPAVDHQRNEGVKVELDPVSHKPRNLDHLPAANTMESVGDYIRKIGSVLRTDHAAYGLRGVCAVMTIAIVGFLHDSQDFYFAQRLLWRSLPFCCPWAEHRDPRRSFLCAACLERQLRWRRATLSGTSWTNIRQASWSLCGSGSWVLASSVSLTTCMPAWQKQLTPYSSGAISCPVRHLVCGSHRRNRHDWH